MVSQHKRLLCTKFVLLLSLFYVQAFAQTDTAVYKCIYIKTAPLGILDFYNAPQLNLSGEFFFSPKYSLHSEFGYQFSFLDFFCDWDNLNGFSIKEELRFYYAHSTERSLYLGVESCFGSQTYSRTDLMDLYPLIPDSTYSYDVKRVYGGVAGNFGFQRIFANMFMTEIYFGLGFRLNHVNTSLTAEQANNRWFGDWTVPHNWIQREGFHIIPKFNFGVRIGFCVRSRRYSDRLR